MQRSEVWIDGHPGTVSLEAAGDQVTLTVDGHVIEMHRSRWMELVFESIIRRSDPA